MRANSGSVTCARRNSPVSDACTPFNRDPLHQMDPFGRAPLLLLNLRGHRTHVEIEDVLGASFPNLSGLERQLEDQREAVRRANQQDVRIALGNVGLDVVARRVAKCFVHEDPRAGETRTGEAALRALGLVE